MSQKIEITIEVEPSELREILTALMFIERFVNRTPLNSGVFLDVSVVRLLCATCRQIAEDQRATRTDMEIKGVEYAVNNLIARIVESERSPRSVDIKSICHAAVERWRRSEGLS